MMQSLIKGEHWYAVKDGNASARHLFHRHYSRHVRKDGRRPKLFVGPGERLVLLTTDARALFVWRLEKHRRDNQQGVNCAVFRNEGDIMSSALILEAETLAWSRWQMDRVFTYINPREIRSQNPGYCFKCAGWVVCGETKVNHLTILEKLIR